MNVAKGWWRLLMELNQNQEDLLIWKLNQLDIFSYAFDYTKRNKNKIILLVWLPELNWTKTERDKLENKLKKTLRDNGSNTNVSGWDFIKEQEWINNWKNFWDIEIVGENFLVLPCWKDLPLKYNKKVVLRIDPGAAFGTGSHPTTSLCLEMMEKTVFEEKKILDVGSGSGILSIAAKKLGAKELYVIDNDYLAINSSKENLLLNFGELKSFNLYHDSIQNIKREEIFKNFDLILCNILASVIKPLIPIFYEILNFHGYLILSGILSTQKEEIIKLLILHHFKIDNVLSKKDWICIKAFK